MILLLLVGLSASNVTTHAVTDMFARAKLPPKY